MDEELIDKIEKLTASITRNEILIFLNTIGLAERKIFDAAVILNDKNQMMFTEARLMLLDHIIKELMKE